MLSPRKCSVLIPPENVNFHSSCTLFFSYSPGNILFSEYPGNVWPYPPGACAFLIPQKNSFLIPPENVRFLFFWKQFFSDSLIPRERALFSPGNLIFSYIIGKSAVPLPQETCSIFIGEQNMSIPCSPHYCLIGFTFVNYMMISDGKVVLFCCPRFLHFVHSVSNKMLVASPKRNVLLLLLRQMLFIFPRKCSFLTPPRKYLFPPWICSFLIPREKCRFLIPERNLSTQENVFLFPSKRFILLFPRKYFPSIIKEKCFSHDAIWHYLM